MTSLTAQGQSSAVEAVDETERLRVLRSYAILDSVPDPAFDEIARLAATVCRAPIALITFIDDSRQWFKSHVGFERRETPRSQSFCAHALGRRDILTIPDARKDPRFAENPLVTAAPFFRFYAGAPLLSPEGQRLGTLCVYDRKARTRLPEQHEEALRVLSRSVMALLEVRRRPQPVELEPVGFALKEVFERVSDAVVALNREWHYTYVNAQAARLFGRHPHDLVGKHIWTEYPSGLGQPFHLAYEKAMAEQAPAFIEAYYPPFDRWFENRIFPSPAGLTIYFHDITARKHAERFLTGQMKVLEAISGGAELGECLRLLVRLIEAQSEELLGSILLLDSDGLHLRHGAAPSLPKEYTQAIDGSMIGPCAGSCGTAAHRREPVFVEEIAADPLWANWAELAHRHGLQACWSTPIFDDQRRVLGTFAIYYKRVGRPSPAHLKLIETATHLAAVAIIHHRNVTALRQSKAALQESAARLSAATQAGGVGVWDRDLVTGKIHWSDITATILGFPPHKWHATIEEVEERIHPEDLGGLKRAVEKAVLTHTPYTHEFRVKHLDGSEHWIAGRAEARYDAAGEAVRLIGVITDISENKRAEAERAALTGRIRAFAARVENVREEERTRIAREIHDVLAQELTRVKIDLIWIGKRVSQPIPAANFGALMERVAGATAQTDAAITAVQKIATELRPVILDRLGLSAAVEWQAEDFTRRTGIPCRAEIPAGELLLDGPRATALFRILQESLTNVVRHAQATSVEVALRRTPAAVSLVIRDNGVGITADQINDSRSIGLVGIRERAVAFGGRAEFSGAQGSGTTVTVELPANGR
jgi:PAS domain S-box-containing protein